jgi:hypothetical protein
MQRILIGQAGKVGKKMGALRVRQAIDPVKARRVAVAMQLLTRVL